METKDAPRAVDRDKCCGNSPEHPTKSPEVPPSRRQPFRPISAGRIGYGRPISNRFASLFDLKSVWWRFIVGMASKTQRFLQSMGERWLWDLGRGRPGRLNCQPIPRPLLHRKPVDFDWPWCIFLVLRDNYTHK